MLSILNNGLTDIRDALAARWTHVGVSTDQTAFSATQSRLNPDDQQDVLIKAAATNNVDFQTVDLSIDIDGDTEFTDQTIWTIGALNGDAATDAMTRSVRTQGIGVQAGDQFTVGVRLRAQDGG